MITPGHTIPVLDHGFVRYVDHMGNDQAIIDAARVSYKSSSKGEEADKKLLTYLWKNKHTSPFEMVKLKLDVKLPIFVARQWIRHRMQNINEVSARYTELPEEFYIPTKWRAQAKDNKQGSVETSELNHEAISAWILDISKDAYFNYKGLIDQGVARELARMVLPLNIYTQWISCWDLKNLLHFVTLREDTHAQGEIQEYAKAIKIILVELFPWTMECYEKYKWQMVESV